MLSIINILFTFLFYHLSKPPLFAINVSVTRSVSFVELLSSECISMSYSLHRWSSSMRCAHICFEQNHTQYTHFAYSIYYVNAKFISSCTQKKMLQYFMHFIDSFQNSNVPATQLAKKKKLENSAKDGTFRLDSSILQQNL